MDKLSQVPDSAKTTKTGSTKKKTQKSSPKKKGGKKTVAKKKTKKKSSGLRLPGGIGPKAVINGVLALTLVPRFIPTQSPGVQVLGSGMALRAIGLGGGGPLSAAGIILTAAEYLGPMLGGLGGGGRTSTNSGGYDY